jgi:hypothetical protein
VNSSLLATDGISFPLSDGRLPFAGVTPLGVAPLWVCHSRTQRLILLPEGFFSSFLSQIVCCFLFAPLCSVLFCLLHSFFLMLFLILHAPAGFMHNINTLQQHEHCTLPAEAGVFPQSLFATGFSASSFGPAARLCSVLLRVVVLLLPFSRLPEYFDPPSCSCSGFMHNKDIKFGS